jgi:nucleoside phosphorylase
MTPASSSPIKSIRFDDLDPIPAIAFAIVTAVDIERDEMLAVMHPLDGGEAILKVGTPEGTSYLGRCGRYPCVLVVSDPGSVGRGGSALTVSDALARWRPYAALMVGIAFGADPTKQKIGDVLVSTQVIPYEPQRKSKDGDVPRGPRPEANLTLLDRVRNLGWSWTPEADDAVDKAEGAKKQRPPIRGPILSGEKLVDNKEVHAQLFAQYPTAVGGEMEGAGFYAAADRRAIPWLIVKAICDWGYDKNKKHQEPAAKNACALIAALLNEPTLQAADFNRTAHPAESRVERMLRDETRRARLQQHRNSVRDAYRDLQRRLDEQFRFGNEHKAEFEASPELRERLAGLDAARLVAVEAYLNACNDAAAAMLHDDVDRAQFKAELGVEIRELCDSETDDVRTRLHPREASSYGELWKVYDEITRQS